MLRTLALLAVASLLPGIAGAQMVRVLYMERPPYYETRDGRPAGFLNDLAAEAFRRAGFTVVFESVPSKRILRLIEEDRGLVCSVGWFKNPEREAFARFSRAISRDQPLVALTRAASRPQFAGRARLAELFADKSLRLGVIAGFSYGAAVDSLMAAARPNRVEVTGNQSQLVRMLASGRLDYLLIAPVEVEGALHAAGLAPAELAEIALGDSPPGNARHLMCNKSFDPGLMDRLDAAIAALAGER